MSSLFFVVIVFLTKVKRQRGRKGGRERGGGEEGITGGKRGIDHVAERNQHEHTNTNLNTISVIQTGG